MGQKGYIHLKQSGYREYFVSVATSTPGAGAIATEDDR